MRNSSFLLPLLILLGPATAAADTWFETRIAIEALAEHEDYTAALERGDELVALAADEFGGSSEQLAESHLFLAEIEAMSGDLRAAERSLLSAVDIYERAEGPLSTRLIEPFVALGDTYHAGGNYAEAMAFYNEARTIGRRAYGLLNQEQLVLIDKMSRSAEASGSREEALELQLEAVTLVQRYHGEDSREFIDANYRYADWLRSRGSFREAALFYYDIGQIIDNHFDDDPRLRIELLRKRALNFRLASGLGVGHRREPDELEQALELIEELPEPDPGLEAEVLTELGDWNVTFERYGTIEKPYLRAWNLLAEVPNGDELRRMWFSGVTVIYAAPLYSRVLSREPDAPRGRVEASFTIGVDGVARDIEIVKSEPQGLMDEAMARHVLLSRFRPQVVDGSLAETEGVIGFDYQYRARFVEPD